MQLSSKEGFFRNNVDQFGMTAVTSTCNVWKSFNQGQTWVDCSVAGTPSNVVNPLSSIISNCIQLIVHPVTNFLYALPSVTPSTAPKTFKIAVSTDGGYNWSAIGTTAIRISATTSQIVAVTDGIVVISRFGGTSGHFFHGDGSPGSTLTSSYEYTTPVFWPYLASGNRLYSSYRPGIYNSNTQDNIYDFPNDSGYFPPSTVFGGTIQGATIGYAPDFDTIWAFRGDGNAYYSTRANWGSTPSGGTNYAGAGSVSQASTIGPQPESSTLSGSFTIAGRGDGNTYYTSLDGITWTTRTLGTNSSGAAVAGVGARYGVFLWKYSPSTANNEGYWTTDRCATVTTRSLPATANWTGVIWQP